MWRFSLLVIAITSVKGYEFEKNYNYETVVINGNYSLNITVTVDAKKEFIIHFPDSTSKYPYTVFASSNQSDPNVPIFVMVRQQKEAISWEIPLLVKSREGLLSFRNTSRTLCHNNIDGINKISRKILYGVQKHEFHKLLTVSLSTASEKPTNVTIRVEEELNFYVNESKNYSITISPSTPKFFYYKFPDSNDTDRTRTVILEIDSKDETCLTVSIQNATCPVFDLNEDISYEGAYETVNNVGGIIIKETEFPNGFFVVFVAKGDNYDCDRKGSVIPVQNDPKIKPLKYSSVVSFKIGPNISKDDYLKYSLATLFGLLLLCFISGTTSYGLFFLEQKLRRRRCENQGVAYESLVNGDEPADGDAQIIVEEQAHTEEEANETGQANKALRANGGGEVNSEGEATETEQANKALQANEDGEANGNPEEQANAEGEATVTRQANGDGEAIGGCQDNNNPLLIRPILYVSDLTTQGPKRIKQESFSYCLQVISVAIFYGIPVVQLVITNLRVVYVTGNLDICYYNFLCAHPYLGLNDYNHVLSNLGYLLFGILFIAIVKLRQRTTRHQIDCGIPKHNGILYAMGTALIMEGCLSMSYHVCPNQSNFQFDTTFMYVIAVLCIIKIYQNRHPDINATSYVTFVVLAIAVFIAMAGILTGHIAVWIVFMIGYGALCLFVSLNVYFVNDARGGRILVFQTMKNATILEALKPIKKARFVFLVAVGTVNMVMLFLAILFYKHDWDFGVFLLAILMVNAISYTIFYIIMKCLNKERFSIQAVIYPILAAGLWIWAAIYFFSNASQWQVTPAESRRWNTHCKLFNFYDNHDIWHILSAIALFFTFMTLLTLDDELVNTPRTSIVCF